MTMTDTTTAQALAGAASYLCSAHDELRAAGYNLWSNELRTLIEIIDAEIEWLRDHETATRGDLSR
jgi:hypothetical protein